MDIDVRFVEEVPEADFIALYKDAGWWADEYDADTSFIRKIVSGSTLFAAVFDDRGAMIGMGRAVSDGCSDAYIQDVVVRRDLRGRGIGGAIIAALTQALTERGIDWIGLIGEPGTESFYSRLGFKRLEKHIPMKFEPSVLILAGNDDL